MVRLFFRFDVRYFDEDNTNEEAIERYLKYLKIADPTLTNLKVDLESKMDKHVLNEDDLENKELVIKNIHVSVQSLHATYKDHKQVVEIVVIFRGFSRRRENFTSILNPTMKRNAEPFYIKDKTKPKEQYSQTLWWTRRKWAGRGETREVTDFVSIPRERYARIEFEPYSVELFLKYDGQGHLIVMTDPISYCQDNEKLLINTINIFLTNFEECEVLTENFENVMPTRIIRLNWEVLPSGDYPWERMQDDLKKVFEKSSKTAKKVLIDKCEFINYFQPDFRAYGKSGFKGYVIFGFTDRDIYVLESVYPNNATYVFGKNWERLSKLTKAEILNGNLQDVRIIHNNNWQQKILDLLEVA